MSAADFSGRTILVAGGAGYLALPAVELMAQQGASIVLADINAERLAAAEGAARQAGRRCCVAKHSAAAPPRPPRSTLSAAPQRSDVVWGPPGRAK